jgi:type VI secretion system secreted protein VgrG
MLNINDVLEKIGLNVQHRTITAKFSNDQLNHQLFLNQFSFFHEINAKPYF